MKIHENPSGEVSGIIFSTNTPQIRRRLILYYISYETIINSIANATLIYWINYTKIREGTSNQIRARNSRLNFVKISSFSREIPGFLTKFSGDIWSIWRVGTESFRKLHTFLNAFGFFKFSWLFRIELQVLIEIKLNF